MRGMVVYSARLTYSRSIGDLYDYHNCVLKVPDRHSREDS